MTNANNNTQNINPQYNHDNAFASQFQPNNMTNNVNENNPQLEQPFMFNQNINTQIHPINSTQPMENIVSNNQINTVNFGQQNVQGVNSQEMVFNNNNVQPINNPTLNIPSSQIGVPDNTFHNEMQPQQMNPQPEPVPPVMTTPETTNVASTNVAPQMNSIPVTGTPSEQFNQNVNNINNNTNM